MKRKGKEKERLQDEHYKNPGIKHKKLIELIIKRKRKRKMILPTLNPRTLFLSPKPSKP
jgi:hypothetical protein